MAVGADLRTRGMGMPVATVCPARSVKPAAGASASDVSMGNHAAMRVLESRRGARFVFIHIPKTAGSTIHHRVLKRSPHFIDVGLGTPRPHFTYDELERQVPKAILDAYWKFCFIRHPVDRYLSRIRYLKSELSAGVSRHSEEREFVLKFDCPKRLLQAAVRENPGFLEARHGLSQERYITDKHAAIAIDFIGTTETFRSDIRQVYRQLRLIERFLRPLRSVNVTGDRYSELRADRELCGLVHEIYANDFAVYEAVRHNRSNRSLKGVVPAELPRARRYFLPS